MRPEDPDVAAKIKAGVLKSMQLAGYDYPVRKLRRHGKSNCVTLPWHAREFLDINRGDWLVFGATPWPGVAEFVKVSAEQYERITPDGRAEFRKSARKVQGRKGTVFVNISQVSCEILSADIGDCFVFFLVAELDRIGVAAVKGAGGSTGSRRTG